MGCTQLWPRAMESEEREESPRRHPDPPCAGETCLPSSDSKPNQAYRHGPGFGAFRGSKFRSQQLCSGAVVEIEEYTSHQHETRLVFAKAPGGLGLH
ncbi:MAG TPA: hypothetical protein DCE44_26520 [Verrucomicrobiales bacterium]|nr:hypothetical protein [Verrucomicrobiales bacterium]